MVERRFLSMGEPSINLDAILGEESRFEIRRLHEEFEITAVYVTCDQAGSYQSKVDRVKIVSGAPRRNVFFGREIRP